MFISNSILHTGVWEKDISKYIKELHVNNYVGREDALFLDIGANLGIHALYAAKLGYKKVWAVEPQQRNIIKVTDKYYFFVVFFICIFHTIMNLKCPVLNAF